MEDDQVPEGLAQALGDLRAHWAQVYIIGVKQGASADEWTAIRRGDGTMLAAATAAELRALMRADYARPVTP